MPEPAKTRQTRQRKPQAEEGAATPEAVAEDVVADPEPDVVEAVDDVEADVVDESEVDEAEALAADVEDDVDDARGWAVEADTTSAAARTKAAGSLAKAEKAPSKSQVERELKAAEKKRMKAEQERRKADFKAARTRQQEADRVQLWAERRQAEADKLRVKAEKAAAKADEARKVAGDAPTDAAARRVASAERWEVYTREKLDRTQSDADALSKRARKAGVHSTRTAGKVSDPGSRQWVPPTFIAVGLVGVLWLVVYYITASTGIYVPGMSDLGGWNVVIGMGLMASAFGIATLWK